MNYGYKRILSQTFDEVDERIRVTLKEQGFGVLTEIDVQEAMQEKLNKEFRRYKILGACNPPIAYQALGVELEIGLLLPCNVVIWENDDRSITLAAIDATKMLSVTGRSDLQPLADKINGLLKSALDAV